MKHHCQRNRIIVTTVFFVGLGGVSSAGEPLDLVKSAGERAIAVLKDPKLKSPDKKKERVERLKEIINPIFDYDEMARRALGPHWRRRTPAEQEEFARLFRAFLEQIYSDKVDLYEGERIVFGRETRRAGVCSSGIDGDQRERRGELGCLPTQARRWKVESL